MIQERLVVNDEMSEFNPVKRYIPQALWGPARSTRGLVKEILIKTEERHPYPMLKSAKIGDQKFQLIIPGPFLRRKLPILLGERKHIERILEATTPDSVYLNVGAHIGIHTIPLALSAGRVYAVEPDPEISDLLSENLLLNGLNRVTVLRNALWNRDEILDLHTDGVDGKAPVVSVSGQPISQKFSAIKKVEAVRLDNLVQQGKIAYPDIVDIDVEGRETEVLEGMGNVVRAKHIFLEIHNLSFGVDAYKVHSMLNTIGYHLEYAWKRGGELLCHYSFSTG